MARAPRLIGAFVAEMVGSGINQNPMVAHVRRSFESWRDPRAKLLRARRRSARSTMLWSGATAVGTGGAAVEFATLATPGMGAFALAGCAVLTATVAMSSGVHTRRLYRTPLPRAARVYHALPPLHSQAREPMRRLVAAEEAFDGLLAVLDTTEATAISVQQSTLDGVVDSADAASVSLRGVAARLQAVERGHRIVSDVDSTQLRRSVIELRDALNEGVAGYADLVAATGRVVAASSTTFSGVGGSDRALLDATDELSGLAIGLRELAERRPC